ncbi:hypothetical protein QKU48_gp0641 [Fadolivirus algeromassiliense]|jgi:hypothetical protein|uniref:Uncharacterized protein n=1 Tax=Fadolivirus FV1/VV64 TaxID=3070911 RepID=A0A7D3QW00_9VIRU|nr:hypothetical protein QKU48_gp0641 [Fadolivirus algeromassiliense]QKF94099.1 hypothetical protein Fadolivirus_1_641 [Fadolivirus FV1/VV64]
MNLNKENHTNEQNIIDKVNTLPNGDIVIEFSESTTIPVTSASPLQDTPNESSSDNSSSDNSSDSMDISSADMSDSDNDEEMPPESFNFQDAFNKLTPEKLKESENIVNDMFKGNDIMKDMMTSIFDGISKMSFDNNNNNNDVFANIFKIAVDATNKVTEKHGKGKIVEAVSDMGFNLNSQNLNNSNIQNQNNTTIPNIFGNLAFMNNSIQSTNISNNVNDNQNNKQNNECENCENCTGCDNNTANSDDETSDEDNSNNFKINI